MVSGHASKPIAHASRALLPAEKNYSQIEKEALGSLRSLKVLPLNFWSILHATNRSQATTHYFLAQKKSSYAYSCEGNVPGHSKRARTCLACRVKTDMAASSIFDEGRSRTCER